MERRRTLTLIAAVVLVAATVGVAVAVRSGSERTAAVPHPSATSPHRVVLPGSPGASARVSDSDRVSAPDGSTFNVVDTTFVQMMIVHHGQAIKMADLATERAGGATVRALAARIGAAQRPEVTWLRAWLRDRGLPEGDPSHDHSTMPGMQSEADMAALAGLRGAEFDRKFVAMMTAHHRGAMRMAGDVISDGSDEKLGEVANEMAVEQGSEIRRMQEL